MSGRNHPIVSVCHAVPGLSIEDSRSGPPCSCWSPAHQLSSNAGNGLFRPIVYGQHSSDFPSKALLTKDICGFDREAADSVVLEQKPKDSPPGISSPPPNMLPNRPATTTHSLRHLLQISRTSWERSIPTVCFRDYVRRTTAVHMRDSLPTVQKYSLGAGPGMLAQQRCFFGGLRQP